jgi:hypothetical protein
VARAINRASEVSVRDAASLGVVQALGSHHEVSVVPDPLLLASRLIGRDEAVARVEYLRAMDGYPAGETVLVEVSAARPADLSALGRAVAGAIVRGYRFSVIAIPSHGETMTAELRLAAERELAPVHCVEQPGILEDLAAMVATANAVVPLSPALLAIACAFGRSSLWRPPASADRAPLDTTLPRGLIHESFDCLLQSVPEPSAADGWRTRVDAHFDAIAVRLSALESGASRQPATAADRMTHLETAHRIVGRRLADERLRFAERTEGLQAESARLKTELARRSALEAVLRQEAADAQAHARHEAARSEIFVRRIERLESTVGRLQAEHAALADERATLVKAALIAAQRREIDELRGAVDRFARSRSWRYLAPARAVGRIIRRALGIRT